MSFEQSYLLSVSEPWLVGRIVAILPYDQVLFEIERCLHVPKKQTQEYWRAQHDQPSPGECIEVPKALLRECPRWVKRRLPPAPKSEDPHALSFRDVAAVIGLCLLCAPVIWWWTTPPKWDAEPESKPVHHSIKAQPARHHARWLTSAELSAGESQADSSESLQK